jgi:hypothetical protein
MLAQAQRREERLVPAPDASEITPVSQWKKSKGSNINQTPLKVPSGNTCLVRMITPEDFLTGGNIPDVLAPIVNEAIRETSGKPPEAPQIAESLLASGDIHSMLKMVDGVVLMAVIEPALQPVPGDHEERSDDLLYVDEVDLEDKMFVMQFVLGGTRDLERFRKEQEATVGGLGSLTQGVLPPK